MINPKVIDLSHYDIVDPGSGQPLDQLKHAGILGIIHKATQGATLIDPTYTNRRAAAAQQGLLWGAYHFNTGENVLRQVDHFLLTAAPDDNTLLALDFEDNRASEMSLEMAADFLTLVKQKTGQTPVIYGGNRIKELLPRADEATRATITASRLWLAQYGPVPHLPEGWERYFLWQYTGDGCGPMPHTVPGVRVAAGIDINSFAGTDDELRAGWVDRQPLVA